MNVFLGIAILFWGALLGLYAALLIIPNPCPDFFKLSFADLLKSGTTLFVGLYIAHYVNFKINKDIKRLEVNRDYVDTLVVCLDSVFDLSKSHLDKPSKLHYDPLVWKCKELSNYLTIFKERLALYHLKESDFDRIQQSFLALKNEATGVSLIPTKRGKNELNERKMSATTSCQQLKMYLVKAKLNLF